MAEDTYRQGSKKEESATNDTSNTVRTAAGTETKVTGDTITVNVGKNYDNFNTNLADIEDTVNYPQRGHEMFLINKRTHSSVAIRQNGQINLASSLYSQYKLNPSGKALEQSLESVAVTNRRKIHADDIVINDHKLNPFLYELTDMKSLESAYNENMLVGNFCIYGSVLVKAWEQNLHRYVLLRRPVRIPMFSPLMNVPEINAGIKVTDPLKVDEQILAKSNKGYQVNKVYTDSNSLIGKEGVDRSGINRNANLVVGDGSNVGAGNSGSASYSDIQINTDAVNLDGMNQPGSGGGQGKDNAIKLVPVIAEDNNKMVALEAASKESGIPMDWIAALWRCETGAQLDGNKAATEFKNYGNMHGDAHKIAVLKKAGVNCKVGHWNADGTNDWVAFDSYEDGGRGWGIWIRYMYCNPPACQQKTAVAFRHSLYHNKGPEGNGDASYSSASGYDSVMKLYTSIINEVGGGTKL